MLKFKKKYMKKNPRNLLLTHMYRIQYLNGRFTHVFMAADFTVFVKYFWDPFNVIRALKPKLPSFQTYFCVVGPGPGMLVARLFL